MEETKPNVPTPPQGLRKMPPPPPRPQAVENNSQPNPEIAETRQEPQMEKKEESLSSLVENDDVVKTESVKQEKPVGQELNITWNSQRWNLKIRNYWMTAKLEKSSKKLNS